MGNNNVVEKALAILASSNLTFEELQSIFIIEQFKENQEGIENNHCVLCDYGIEHPKEHVIQRLQKDNNLTLEKFINENLQNRAILAITLELGFIMQTVKQPKTEKDYLKEIENTKRVLSYIEFKMSASKMFRDSFYAFMFGRLSEELKINSEII
jgi:hypothetical protein